VRRRARRIEDVLGRDPRLRQATDHHQPAQQPRVSAIGLRALLAPPSRGGLRRLGQMHPRAYPVQLLHDETPPSGGLQGHLELRTIKARQELAHALAMRRRDPRAGDFARHRVDPLRSDLRSVLVESQYDCHLGPPQAPWFEHQRRLSALELKRSLLMPPLRASARLSLGRSLSAQCSAGGVSHQPRT
jgi:hypothetical protein